MKSHISIVLSAALLAVAAPAFAGQIQASPGVTLTEAAQAKFNKETRGDDRHVKPVAGTARPSRQLYASAGLSQAEGDSMTLEQVFVAKINRESRGDDEQRLAAAETVSMGSRAYGNGSDYAQLASSAGLDRAEASGMSLTEIAAAKFAKESSDD